MAYKKFLQLALKNPKRLFLFDAGGALLSAAMLTGVLAPFSHLFGIPVTSVYLLAAIPCVFVLYDLWCIGSKAENKAPYLKVIAAANLLYCCLSLVLALYHHHTTTTLGMMYIVGEIGIVSTLAIFELQVARKMK